VIGHEFLGEIIETGPGVRRHKSGDRVVVCSFIGCGRCWYCAHDLWSLCDNSNANSGLAQMAWGYETGAVFGYSHMMGGFAGSHAEYVRVPFADYGAFTVPDGVDDISAVFTADVVPTGWMGADLGGVQPGDVVAVWGAGGGGQMAARASVLLGAEKVMVIDRIPERLSMAGQYTGAETIDYSATDVGAELRERTGGGSGRLHRGGRHGSAQPGPAVPLRPGQAAAPAAIGAAAGRPRRDPRLPEGRFGVRARRVRRAGGQVPARRADEQGVDRARRAGARPSATSPCCWTASLPATSTPAT
jgi:threonine dehydrogenase-like Zn-dependent dehydrogenase